MQFKISSMNCILSLRGVTIKSERRGDLFLCRFLTVRDKLQPGSWQLYLRQMKNEKEEIINLSPGIFCHFSFFFFHY